jgi:hypothetical protein
MAQTDAKTVTIDGHTYKVYMLDPLTATDLLADISSIVVPSLAALGGKVSPDELKEVLASDADAPDLGGAYERAAVLFFQRFDKTVQRAVISKLATVTAVVLEPNKEPMLDSILAVHFKGRIGALYQWLFFALKVQFGDFFVGMVPAIQSAVRGLGRAP